MTVFPSPPPPPPFLSCRAYNRNSTFLLPLPSPSRSSPTLAHNLYYDRGAHIINLIKRSALKIVLLVRQLLTAAACLPAPSLPPFRSLFLRFVFRASIHSLFAFSSLRHGASLFSLSLFLSFSFHSFFPLKLRNTFAVAKFSKDDNRVRQSRIERFVNTLLRRVLFFFFGYMVRRRERIALIFMNFVKWNLFRPCFFNSRRI